MLSDNTSTLLDEFLFDAQPDCRADQINGNGALYFGTGLKSYKNGLTCGLPFEYLGMFCVATRLAAQYGFKRVIQEITDTYDDGVNDNATQIALSEQRQCLRNLITRLQPEFEFSCIAASEIRSTDSFQMIRDRLSDAAFNINCPQYAISQSAGLEHLCETANVTLKLGWAVEIQKKPMGLDERFFNQIYRDVSGRDDFNFLYMKRTVDADSNRTSPYFAQTNTNRLMITGGTSEQIEWLETLETSSKKSEVNYYRNIEKTVRLFDALIADGVFQPRMNYSFDAPLRVRARQIITNFFGVQPVPNPSNPFLSLQYGAAYA